MPALSIVAACALTAAYTPAAEAPPEAVALLEEALTLARSIPDNAARADAVGLVAGEIARIDPRRALKIVGEEIDTHEQSLAMARAAEVLARDNRFLGLATLIRIGDRSAVLVALARILAMEAFVDFDEAIDITERIDLITVRRIVEREATRIMWAELPVDRASAVDVALRWANAIDDPVTQSEALAYAAEGAATLDLQRAEEIAQRIPDAELRDLAYRLVVQQTARSDPAAARDLIGRIRRPLDRLLAGASVVAGFISAGREQEALDLGADIRESVAEDLENLLNRGLVLELLAEAIVDAEPATALSIVTEVWPPDRRYALQCRLAESDAHRDAVTRLELLEDAWVEVRRNDSPMVRRRITAAALAAAERVAPEFIDKMAGERPDLVQTSLPDAVELLAADDPELALQAAARIADPRAAERAQVAVVTATAEARPEFARTVADALKWPGPKSAALVALAAARLALGFDSRL